MSAAAEIHRRDAARGGFGRHAQRWGALAGGAALAAYGVTRKSAAGWVLAAAGGALVYSGVRSDSTPRRLAARASVVVNAAAEELFGFWRNFENLPRFMRHLDSVTVLDGGRSRWIALGPMGKRIQWTAEIVHEVPNQSISWRSLPESDVEVDGTVEFTRATGNRGTLVNAIVQYRPGVGALGRAAIKLLAKDPSFLMQQDLRRFKALIETGEIPTTDGQSHGPRDLGTAMFRLADPDRPFRAESDLRDVLEASRRVS